MLNQNDINEILTKIEKTFFEGHFDNIKRDLLKILQKDENNPKANQLLGKFELLRNNLSEAEKFLLKALELSPKDSKTLESLCYVYYRQDDFEKASYFFSKIGREVIAKKLELFKDKKSYTINNTNKNITTVLFD